MQVTAKAIGRIASLHSPPAPGCRCASIRRIGAAAGSPVPLDCPVRAGPGGSNRRLRLGDS